MGRRGLRRGRDELGWDRTSVREAAWFALVAFGLTAFAQAGIAIGLVVGQVAPAIASERDLKSLDALLATQLSSAKIVVGTMAAGLLRAANGLAAALPLVVLMVFLGGVDPGLVLLSCAGLALNRARRGGDLGRGFGRQRGPVAGPSLSLSGWCSRGLLFPPPFWLSGCSSGREARDG